MKIAWSKVEAEKPVRRPFSNLGKRYSDLEQRGDETLKSRVRFRI